MGVRYPRKKPRNLLLSLLYWTHRVLPLGTRSKLKLYLELEWIFERLALETSFQQYGPEAHPFRRFAREFLLRRIDANMTVLDLGCHSGDVGRAIAAKAYEVVGVDHDAGAIAKAKAMQNPSNLSFFHTDALEFLRSNTKRFDLLVLSHILEHLDEPKEFLMSFREFFSFIYIELPDFDKTYLNQYRLKLGAKLNYTDDDHVTEFDRYELGDLLISCGIEVIEAEYRFGVQRLWCRVLP